MVNIGELLLGGVAVPGNRVAGTPGINVQPPRGVMTELIAYQESDDGDCWARFRLGSGEPCWMRVSMKGVTVKRSGLGLSELTNFRTALRRFAVMSLI